MYFVRRFCSSTTTTTTITQNLVNNAARDTLPKVLVIAGPTGIGKTEISIKVAEKLNGEIICADSIQVYKNLQIGSNKITVQQQKQIKHHMFDILDVNEEHFNAQKYFIQTVDTIKDIVSRGKTPIIVGGCGFYIECVVKGLHDQVSLTNEERDEIKKIEIKLKEKENWIDALNKLKELDPESANRLVKNDYYRLAKSLYINSVKGERYSSYIQEKQLSIADQYDFRSFYLTAPRTVLMEILNQRSEKMIAQGIIQETVEMLMKGWNPFSRSSQSIGYRETIDILLQPPTRIIDDEKTAQFIRDFQSATRIYSRRQQTWFKRDANMEWIIANPLPNFEPVPPPKLSKRQLKKANNPLFRKEILLKQEEYNRIEREERENKRLKEENTISSVDHIIKSFNQSYSIFQMNRNREEEDKLKVYSKQESKTYPQKFRIFETPDLRKNLVKALNSARAYLSRNKPELFTMKNPFTKTFNPDE
ncbi:hypothetical protein CYY_010358 [Polysphondylium violaceum]|uniref:tRNA dimethylallyltransferase n=1 Tax=Polysphondylium violaceum TaxID=133409 RepID=A0A8J4PKB2_9MYCE|nr:hypothetical protein CYY_010358 [Polysphondylium violaceum]